MTNSKRTNPIKPPICINDFLRIAVISLSLFCKSDCTFFSIWQINPCSCLLSSALRAARLSACSDNRRLCAFCSLTMFLLDERSVVVVVVGFALRNDAKDKERILRALKQTNGNRSAAAELLGISRSALYSRLEEYGLKYKFRQS